ncbi:PREDICTED: putative N-acetyltransferase 8B [Nanorana parkeri]|uniref:putative N-acetyltransferase 8B n=1 Tax=Nanorana parkeri TaxID=125878 RepID=UPI00085471BA|nr:PREDICTED: putative N-acetyltransferase 8B [Nanorana parkeri]
MADYHIRLYQDSDYDMVRDIFVCGITEPYPASFRHTFSLPRVWILILAVFLLALITTGSPIVSFIAVIMVILVLLLMNRAMFFFYARRCLATDMLDIRKNYLQRDGCGFWVAESAGEIVGIVAAAPFPHGQNQVELKRLSVPKKHRGKGLGKALCKTVIDFAQKYGYEAVVLESSIFRKDSIRLYKRLGFRITGTYHQNHFFLKFIDYLDIVFQYDLS